MMSTEADRYVQQVIAPGDAASRIAKEKTFPSHAYNPTVCVWPQDPGNFRGAVAHSWSAYILEMMCHNFDSAGRRRRTPFLGEVTQNDGLGGKPQFATLISTGKAMRGLGHDAFAMGADDMRGCLPAWADNEVCVKRITKQNLHLFESLMSGYNDACKEAGLVNVTGELAVMRDQITAFCDEQNDEQLILTQTVSCTGLLYQGYNLALRKVTGAGMPIVGLKEDGYRCNGGGWLTNLLLAYYGDVASIRSDPNAMIFVADLLTPSKIYCKAMARAMGWTRQSRIGEPLADIRAVAHITGGGLAKLAEALPENVGAILDSMPDPPQVLLQAQEMSWSDTVPEDLRLTDERGYTTFHGGCGMMVVVANDKEAAKLIKVVGHYGIKAQVVGFTIPITHPSVERVRLTSRYLLKNGQRIFPLRKDS